MIICDYYLYAVILTWMRKDMKNLKLNQEKYVEEMEPASCRLYFLHIFLWVQPGLHGI